MVMFGWSRNHGSEKLRRNAAEPFLVIFFYSVLYLAFFSPVIFSHRLLAPGDGLRYYLPNFYLGRKLWDPLIFSGFPVAADPQAMTWYPLAFILSLFPHSWNVFVMSAYVLASSFTYGYMLTVTGSRLAGYASGIVYGMSGFMMGHLGHTSIIHAAVWLPLLIWALEKMHRGFSPSWFFVANLAVACCALSGHPQILAYVLCVGALYALFRGRSLQGKRLRYYALSAGIAVIGLALAAIQLVPTIELARLGVRTHWTFADFISYSFPLHHAITLLFPYLFGGIPASIYGLPYFGSWNQGEMAAYVGLLPLLLVGIGVFLNRRNSLPWFWAAIGVFGVLLALGDSTPLAKLMFHVPVYNKFRIPARHFLEISFAASVLAGFGIRALEGRHDARGLVTRAIIAGSLVMGGGLASILLLSDKLRAAAAKNIAHVSFSPWMNHAVGVPLILFAVGSAALIIWAGRTHSRVRQAFLLSVLIVDLGSFSFFIDWHYWSPKSSSLDPPSSATIYRPLVVNSYQRMISVRGTQGSITELPPNTSRLFGIPNASGYGPLILSRVSQLLSMAHYGEVAGTWSAPDERSLDLMAARFVFLAKGSADSATVDDPAGTAWSKEDMGIRLGSGCGISHNASMALALPALMRTTEIGMISAMSCSTGIPDDAEVAQILLTDVRGKTQTASIRAGRDTSELAFDCSDVRPLMKHRRASVFESFPVNRNSQQCEGHQYAATLLLGAPAEIKKIELRSVGSASVLTIMKMRLHDRTTGRSYLISSRTSSLADTARWRHAEDIGETSVYENLRAMPRAWLVPEVVTAQPEEILSAVKSSRMPDGRIFDPAKTALVEEPLSFKAQDVDPGATVQVAHMSDTSVEVHAASTSPTFLVLSDVNYPGWKATIDGVPIRIFQTDYVLRGVMVPSGGHIIMFEFKPPSLYIGLAISVVGFVIIIFCTAAFLNKRKHNNDGAHEKRRAS